MIQALKQQSAGGAVNIRFDASCNFCTATATGFRPNSMLMQEEAPAMMQAHRQYIARGHCGRNHPPQNGSVNQPAQNVA